MLYDLEKLEDNQLLTMAIVCFFYSHVDPMSLLTRSLADKKMVQCALWFDTASGNICMRKNSLINHKGVLLKLVDTRIPVNEVIDTQDGRSEFIFSVFSHLIHLSWSGEINKQGITDKYMELLRKNLASQKHSLYGSYKATDMLDNIITPVLLERNHNPATFH